MDIQNHYYGHSAVLALYAAQRSVRHIDGLLQHGWTVASPVRVHFADFPTLPRGARRLVWSHQARGWDPGEESAPTTPIGAPFLYLSALTASIPVEPLGTAVAFPVHDTRLVKIAQDDVLARELAEREGPSIVCLHPEDLDSPVRLRTWQEQGHRVVSAGQRRDPLFLGRILRLVRGARSVVSNQLSTAVIYAAAEGTPTALHATGISIGALGTSTAERTQRLWPEFHAQDANVDLLRGIARAELGAAHLREPDELREILGWDRCALRPAASYWAGAPLRKAGAVLGVFDRAEGAADAGAGVSPLTFLRHPLSHLPGRLPRLPGDHELLPNPLSPVG
ncbi:hypothetical protein JSY14_03065 [Brachybacterium sp. EF45031]|uniref:hypothetical protein n=1 Tax=Brachybacterium sillae TaxID=2810536 RepID=UPI00217E21F3|nr:hypothetical protein [Brachybacterium sillae]MCS6711046.1 hypothetical protein [Brachybacterium sillae]